MVGFQKSDARSRPWIAAAMAYVVALQIIFAGFSAGPPGVARDLSSNDVFIVCFGHSINQSISSFTVFLTRRIRCDSNAA